jgi:hypothetical protein
MYKGNIKTWVGIINIEIKNKNIKFFPLNLVFANAYAAKEHNRISINIAELTIIKLLANSFITLYDLYIVS